MNEWDPCEGGVPSLPGTVRSSEASGVEPALCVGTRSPSCTSQGSQRSASKHFAAPLPPDEVSARLCQHPPPDILQGFWPLPGLAFGALYNDSQPTGQLADPVADATSSAPPGATALSDEVPCLRGDPMAKVRHVCFLLFVLHLRTCQGWHMAQSGVCWGIPGWCVAVQRVDCVMQDWRSGHAAEKWSLSLQEAMEPHATGSRFSSAQGNTESCLLHSSDSPSSRSGSGCYIAVAAAGAQPVTISRSAFGLDTPGGALLHPRKKRTSAADASVCDVRRHVSMHRQLMPHHSAAAAQVLRALAAPASGPAWITGLGRSAALRSPRAAAHGWTTSPRCAHASCMTTCC
jgi:hypothetical protein